MSTREDAEKMIKLFRSGAKDDSTTVLWLRTNIDVLKLVAAWGKVQVEFVGTATKAPKDKTEQWNWLWRNYRFDVREWLRLAGVMNHQYGARLVDRIIGLRLVFPDLTYPQWVQTFIEVTALAQPANKTTAG